MSKADAYPRHIVAACALIRNTDERVLMIRSPKRGWEIPGGQIEEGEDLISGLKREVLEESGIVCEIEQLVSVVSRVSAPSIVIFSFIGRYLSGSPQTSPESLEVEWVDRKHVLERVQHHAVRARCADLLAWNGQIRYRVNSEGPYEVLHEQHI